MQPKLAALVEGERALTYGELAECVLRAAGHLTKLGVVRGDQIGVCLKDDSQHIIALLAIAYLGATAVQIDSRSRPTERARILDALPVRLAIATSENDKGISAPKVFLDSASQLPIGGAIPRVNSVEDWHAPIATLASSGTTGLPKFTTATHFQYLFHILSYLEVIPPRRHRYLSTLPLYFSAGRVACLAHLMRGDTLILYPALFSPEEFIDKVTDNVTLAFVVPSVLRQLLAIADDHSPLFSKLDLLISGGAPFFAEEKLQVIRKLTPRFCELYGTAALGPMSGLRGEDVPNRPTSVGRPFSFIDVEIVDDDDRPLPPGATGQLRCRGPGLTAPIAMAAPVTDFRNGWYYPGELGTVDELGYIFLQGRTSEVIFRGGAKIFPSEVEAVLQMHECVAEAAVVGRALPNNEQDAVAFVILKHPSTSGELLAHCRTRLTAFKVPREIHIVAELPRNLSGKIDKRALTEVTAHGAN